MDLNTDELSVQERLELIGRLWDSIPNSEDTLAIPDWHRDELDRRLREADASPEAGIPWATVQAQLRGG